MMISLTEAINIISIIRKKLSEAYSDLNRVSTVTYAKGDERPENTDDVDNLVAEINALQEDLVNLSKVVELANINTLTDFAIDDRKLTISEAISRAQIWRGSLGQLKKLADCPAKPVLISGLYRDGNNYNVATFDVDKYKKIIEAMEKKVNRLSLSIDKANAVTEVEFANVGKYLV